MELRELASAVQGFSNLSHPERIKHFAWFLHTHGGKTKFDGDDIRASYDALDMEVPNVGRELTRLVERRALLKDGAAYRLEHRARQALDAKYGEHETTILVSHLLKDL